MKKQELSDASGKRSSQQQPLKGKPLPRRSPYQVRVGPLTFILISIGSSVLPYILGQWISLHRPELAKELQRQIHSLRQSSNETKNSLPKILLKSQTIPPETKYTSKVIFEPSGSVHHWDSVDESLPVTCTTDHASTCSSQEAENVDNASFSSGELHEPSGQHLLVDFEHVDPEFLASEERLAKAMVLLIEKSKLTMLSYHCHSYERFGVSCVGVLMESHVSLHSFPAFGILALDLFTCGRNNPLLPIVPYIEELFGIRATNSPESEDPHMVWSHKRRGYSLETSQEINREEFDYHWALGFTDYEKIQVIEEETDFQMVQIVDIHDGDNLDRILYLDGVMQSRKRGEAAYHEALVHTAMFVHSDPRRVAIIGGGEGATLREVLKHNTVDEVVMIEIDEQLVEIAKEYLPEWNDCSFLVGGASCFDDPRASIVFTDAIAWFLNHFGNATSSDFDPFDVIIMDAL